MSRKVVLWAGDTADLESLTPLQGDVEHHRIGSTVAEAGRFDLGEVLRHPQTISVLILRQKARPWLEFIQAFRANYPACFIIFVHQVHDEADNDALLRMELSAVGVSMVTVHVDAVQSALQTVFTQIRGRFPCAYCKLELTEDSLWTHTPFYHVNDPNQTLISCPICPLECNRRHGEVFPVHLRNAHGPCARGEVPSEYSRRAESIYAFALVVCIREVAGRKQMLLVQEFASKGFWLPGGRVEVGEDLQTAAIRECEEEAGCRINLQGILQFNYTPHDSSTVRLRVTFFARPTDPEAPVKTLPDFESAGATWVDLQTIRTLHEQKKLRHSEPYEWAGYLLNGGKVHSMDLLSQE